MKFLFTTLILLSSLLIKENKVYSATDYQITEICRRKKNKYSCIKLMKEKKSNLLKGNRIQIPVIPFKR